MKKAKPFLGFLRAERMLLISLVLCYGIYWLVFTLYRQPVEMVGYAFVLSLVPITVMELIRYLRYRARALTLAKINSHIGDHPPQLPESKALIENQYQQIIWQIEHLRAGAVTALDLERSERMEYFTLWAHQIKTPIAAMRLLLQADDTQNPAELKAQLFLIEQYVELALSYQRLENGLNDLVIKEYPLDQIISSALKKYARLFILKKLTLNYQPSDVRVLTDEKWLCFVIEQILSNAIKYTAQGGVTIELEGDSTLVIRDTGIGIAPEDLPRICERGYTGYNGRADHKSTGIGLYLCKRVMGKLNHGLRFESVVSKGTSVYLSLGRRELPIE